MNDKDDLDLGDRAQAVLKALVQRYIEEGNPIGSRTVAQETDLSLSPATIRNVMADLEEHGLIRAPHTSSGRVPTQKGYRFFINSILQVDPMRHASLGQIAEQFTATTDTNAMLASASETLSKITSFAGIVSMPAVKLSNVRQIEFLSLSQQRVLAILITEDGQVQNKILSLHREYSDSELTEATNYFNAKYSGKPINNVRDELIRQMHQDHRNTHKEMRAAISMAGQLFAEESISEKESILVSGENNLLSVPDFAELDKLRQLFDTLKTKQILFDLLQKSMFTEGVNIFIGEESGYQMFQNCSVIASSYEVDNEKVGVLGVIGPTRMQYDEVISAVDVTAKLLGSALSNQLNSA